VSEPVSDPAEHFAFGENWRKFSALVSDERIRAAESSLASMLHVDSLEGSSFLDIGCGSGLFSLAAARLGAGRIHSFDYDNDSVECTAAVKERFLPEKADWTIERGDIADPEYSNGLGSFDVVYSWGVLHHTGAMWEAMTNACALVAPGGTLFVSIYNDQGRRSKAWRRVKRLYNDLPRPLRVPYALVITIPRHVPTIARATATGKLGEYVRSWVRPRERGMSRWHDVIDWIGGYPFEVAKPEEIFRFCRDRGFILRELETQGGDLGCNQFVFHRVADDVTANEDRTAQAAANSPS
jgi:2-polyprenyl-6-hydroxyphenyl methylase/3-demethylubiquinone-9 3-methyltransferase